MVNIHYYQFSVCNKETEVVLSRSGMVLCASHSAHICRYKLQPRLLHSVEAST